MVDWDRILQLQDEIGEEDFQDVVVVFLEEVGSEVDTLTTVEDADALEAKLHFLKGSALNLGLSAFASICQTGETLARNGRPDAVDLNEIRSCYKASIDEFSDVVSGAAPT
jgi:HPt (histidine-containing phosphotransfer) domain-containing protein